MSKKIFIIFGHNRYKSGSSFNAAIRDTFINEAKKIGHEIDVVNVYDERQIKFWDGGEPDEQILDCLLYTSPSPRDVKRSRMPSSA